MDVQLPPLRSLDEFLLNSARFSPPMIGDMQRWNNRVINNLLYYQTNYGVLLLGQLLIGGYFRPLKMLLCVFVLFFTFLAFVWAAETQALVRRFRRKHPTYCLLGILLTSFLILYLAGSKVVLLLVYIFPFLLIIIHASLRLRNLRNKIENRLTNIGLKRTPMGLLLEALGQEQEAGS
ncbi:PRA1 family protein 2-like [Microcaecilia unicolor]|uniref:PRA1 family protein n=1 Tax=Microcaecilia unicolor TaxID=1415580 RepID=A0A6P7X907_9AMPH|nr:PRA1 family protein 2-like [Microcaecilia unicolor]